MRPVDLVLSSGFLAFARHVGFLHAVEQAGLEVEAVCGTSSGAMVAALWCARVPADQISELLSSQTPIRSMSFHARPWQGLFSMRAVMDRLAAWLPSSFAELERPLAVGVVDASGRHRLLTEGPLIEAVAASCAMPVVFRPVEISGVSYHDGGTVDRLGIEAWRAWREGRAAIVHHVERSAGREVETDLEGLTVVRTPRSGASFFGLGDFDAQVEEARRIAEEALGELGRSV